ncbi:hypothetical protein HDU78_008105, partial [Chytriomyces hyalinus]
MGKEVAKKSNGKVAKAAAVPAKAAVAAKKAKVAAPVEEEESDDQEEDDEEESAEEEVAAAGESEESDDDEDEEEEEEKPVSKKRAAEESTAPAKKQNTAESTDTTVFIGNLSWNTDEDAVAEVFADCGDIASVRLISGPDGRKKGFGYVEFKTSAGAKKALELAGTEVDGREIKVDISTPRTEKKKEAGAPCDTLFVGNVSSNATEDGLT